MSRDSKIIIENFEDGKPIQVDLIRPKLSAGSSKGVLECKIYPKNFKLFNDWFNYSSDTNDCILILKSKSYVLTALRPIHLDDYKIRMEYESKSVLIRK